MLYKDRVYGEIEITEPVILDLINSPAMQRLRGIEQAGYFEVYFPGTSHSRFEHSLGVFILLKKYRASLEEQIAGLIHDVSHSAFSHCADYILDVGSEKEQNHQDNVFEEFIRKTEIPEILKKYELDTDYILDDKNFPLKEKELPDLCADRIDYSLRTAIIYMGLGIDEIKYFLNNLAAENQKWVFKNFESAKKYAELFLLLNRKYYSNIESAAMFRTVGDCIRYAIHKGYIAKEDLYKTDRLILAKIEKYLEDEKLRHLFDRMNNKIKFENNPNDYDAKVFCKSRVVDPLCFHNGEILRVSDIDEKWKEILKEESRPKEYFLKFAK